METKHFVNQSEEPLRSTHRTLTRYSTAPSALSSMVTGNEDILGPVGFRTYQIPIQASEKSSTTVYKFDINKLKDFITDKKKTTKIRPVLVSFSGLPESGKSMALQHFLNNYVVDCPLTPVTRKTERDKSAGISYYELIAAGLSALKDLCITEVTQESSLAAGILSAFKQDFVFHDQIPLFDLTTTQAAQPFEDRDLDDHLQFIYRYLCDQKSIPKGPDLQDKDYGDKLKSQLPKGVALINIWDLAISDTVRHFLTALRDHLHNNHMWLFLDLERDLDHLHEPPEIKDIKGKGDGAVFMKWRSRLHYMLRSCQICESSLTKKRKKKVCTIFAKHKGLTNGELQEKVEMLEEKVKPAAEHIGVSSLLEEKIQTISLGKSDGTDDSSQSLSQKFQQVIYETPFQDIPLAWVFFRCLFYRYEKEVVSREELKKMALKCGIDEDFEEFCKFYTSFGSIFDLSLINPNYNYVIIKPIRFLKLLDNFFHPSDKMCEEYPTILSGIVPEDAFKREFGVDWPAFVDALITLNFATRITNASLTIPVDRNEMYYYISLSRNRKAPLISDVDCNSVHVITNIDIPHVFKQVVLTRHLLKSLPFSKLKPCPNMNRTIIKDDTTTLTLVSHSPATRLHLDKPNVEMCSCIVEAYRDIAATCGATTKYKFVVLCSNDVIPNVQSIPSSHYHILPDDELCDTCKEDPIKMEVVKVWIEALRKYPTDDNSKPTEDLNIIEIATISERIASWKINTKSFIEVFQPEVHIAEEYKSYPIIDNDKVATEIILSWHKKERGKRNNKEIRGSFARKLSELGKKLNERGRNTCEKMAKEIAFNTLVKS